LVAGLTDRYGPYGKIGFCLLECDPEVWRIKLLLMSCRVASRGVGTALITHVRGLARAAGVKLCADFVANDRNRQMYVTYKFNRFREIAREGERTILENDLSTIPSFPPYVELRSEP
jgi:predicted enzyme involved in methoxymalonyl-ACP biosynthesis